MNQLSNSISTITSPEQAVEGYIGEQFIEWLNVYISTEFHTWPISQKIAQSKPRIEKIRKLMLQEFLVSEAFLGAREGDPGFLRFAIANLSESDDPQAETALEILEKLRVDELIGHTIERGIIKTAVRDRWIRLLKVLGASDEEIERAEPKEGTRNYIAELSDVYSNSEWQTAIGAFVSAMRQQEEEYKIFLNMLKANTEVSEKDFEILNQIIAINHILDKIAFDREAKELVWTGVQKQLSLRQEFLNGLEKYLV